MIINTALCMMGVKMKGDSRVLIPVFVIIGWQLGSRFSPAIWASFSQWLLASAFLILWMILSVLLASAYFRRVAGYDKQTAVYASLPGALASIISFIQGAKVNERQVIVSQTVRILMVVGLLPFVFSLWTGISDLSLKTATEIHSSDELINWGVLMGVSLIVILLLRILRIPSPYLLGSALVAAIFYTQGWISVALPDIVLSGALYILGCIIGSRFADTSWQEILHIGKHGIVVSFLLIVFSCIGALICAYLLKLNLLGLFLAFVPGGVHEMTILAFAYGAEPLLVAFLHLMRLAVIILSLPWLGRAFKEAHPLKNSLKK